MRGLQGVYPARFTNRRSVFRNREKGEIIRHSSKWESSLKTSERSIPVFRSKQKPMPISLQSVGQFNLVPIPETRREKKIRDTSA